MAVEKENTETKKEFTPKQDAKGKQSVKAKDDKAKDNKTKPKKKSFANIDDFIKSATPRYGLSQMQIAGFKGYMQGKHLLKDEKEFLVYLEKYLKGE